MIRLHISGNSDVFKVAASHSLNLSTEHADKLPMEQSNNQIVMQECSSAAALNALQADIKSALAKLKLFFFFFFTN